MKNRFFRNIALFLVAGLMVTGCGSSSTETETDSADVDEEEALEEEAVLDEDADTEEDSSAETETESTFTFEEMTVVDNDDCTIKITGIEPDDLFGYSINVELVNKTDDTTYMFATRDTSINGVASDPVFAEEVSPGKTSIDSITFMEDLNEYGVGEYTDIEIEFYVYDSDDWTADYIFDETVHVYPYGEDAAVKYEYEIQDLDIVVVDDENISIIITGYDTDNIWGYAIEAVIVNKTDSTIMVSTENESINGYMASPIWASEIPGGTTSFESITWYSSTLESIGIDASEVEEIEMTMKAYNSSTYNSLYEGTVAIDTIKYFGK